MYQINPITNELIELRAKRFSELGFKEREHLQEWEPRRGRTQNIKI